MTPFDRLALALVGTALIAAAVLYIVWRIGVADGRASRKRRLGADPTDEAGA